MRHGAARLSGADELSGHLDSQPQLRHTVLVVFHAK
jgi:hypothetical protein